MKKRKLKTKYIIIVAILFIFIIVFMSFFIKRKKEISYQNKLEIKIGDKIPKTMTYKEGKNSKTVDIIWKDVTEDSMFIANQYKGSFKVDEKEYEVLLTVIDDEAPVISGVKDIEINEHEEIDFLKEIEVTDNSKDKVEIEVKGEYDITKKGQYKLYYEATDKSGNTKTETFSLIVKENTVVGSNAGWSNKNRVVGTTKKGYKIELIDGLYYIDGILIANKTYALPSNYAPGGLLQELNIAFSNLKSGAEAEGLNYTIISGYRSYNTQNSLYNNYVARDGREEADTYSARPGHSEHQTGLAIDVNSLYVSFGETREGQWLKHNCYKYGFIIRYPEGKENITGYMYEPWHLRYVGDIAEELYNNGDWITLEEYLGITSEYQ